MIEEVRRRQLEAFEAALEAVGFDVARIEPQLRDSIVKRLAGEEDDTVGFVVVNTPIELLGTEFDAELVVTVFRDRVASHGVDVSERDNAPLDDDERELLDSLVPPRSVEGDGGTDTVWTYYPAPADLPDEVGVGDRDNVDAVMAEIEAVFEDVEVPSGPAD